jgi:sarcosine oxidase delta subunit
VEHIQIGTKDAGAGTAATITKPLDSEPRAKTFLAEYLRSRSIPVNIYSMTFSTEKREFKLNTTSKDVFLQLGAMDEEGQRAFGLMVYHRATMDGRALVTFPHTDGCKGYLCIVTRGMGNDHEERIHIDISIASDK